MKMNTDNWIFIFCILLFFRILSPQTASLSLVLVGLYAFLGGRYIIRSFLMSWFFTLINPAIAPEPVFGAVLRYFIIICGFLSIFYWRMLDGKFFIFSKISIITMLLCFCIILHCFFISYTLDVSLLKIISWMVVVTTLLLSWSSLLKKDQLKLIGDIEYFIKIIICVSIPFLFYPAIGFSRNETGFQGVLNHPQAFGPTVALLGVIVAGRLLSSQKQSKIDFLFFIFCISLVILSEARTAGLALFSSLILAVITSPLITNKPFFNVTPALKSKFFIRGLTSILLIVLLSWPLVLPKVENYIFKRSDTNSLIEAADSSRGVLVDRMISNIKENPVFGIGFGLSSNKHDFDVQRDPVFGIPVSAAIEKGVLPVAVIEELGFFVGGLVFMWIFWILKLSVFIGLQNFSLLLAIFLVNLGEYMFFSVGGMGMLLLVLMTGYLNVKRDVS